MEFSRNSCPGTPFHDIIDYDAADGMIGPDACKRLAVAYKEHPWVSDQAQVHQEIGSMIQIVAEHGGCLIISG